MMKTSDLIKLAQDVQPYNETITTRVRAVVGEVFKLRRKLAVLRAGGPLPLCPSTSVSARAREIATSIKTMSLGRVDEAIGIIAERIESLVHEATRGAPRPVNPPHDSRYVFPWDDDGWVICSEEPEVGPRPLVIFVGYGARQEAESELRRRQALDPEDDDHLSDESGILSTQVALSIWNCIDPDPRRKDGADHREEADDLGDRAAKEAENCLAQLALVPTGGT